MKHVNMMYPMLFIAVCFLSSVGYMGYLLYYNPDYTSELIVADIAKLVAVFQKIDAQCSILGFDAQHNPINFLNVMTFAGSEVGPMNLVHPEKWQGPYLPDHPSLQSIEYMVVKTDKGYFITPGIGVRLPNGKVMGTDIVLDAHSDIPALMKADGGLRLKEYTFAAPLLGPAQPAPEPTVGQVIAGMAE